MRHKTCSIRPSDIKNWTDLSRQIRVCVVQKRVECGRRRVKGIQLRYCTVWSEESECVKYCVRDRCQGYEPGELNVSLQIYLLSLILTIIASVLISLLTVKFVVSVVSINAVIC
jgi:hypothetical protein